MSNKLIFYCVYQLHIHDKKLKFRTECDYVVLLHCISSTFRFPVIFIGTFSHIMNNVVRRISLPIWDQRDNFLNGQELHAFMLSIL